MASKTFNGEWTVVSPRRGKHRSKKPNLPKTLTVENSWTPTDSQTDPERESKLLRKMQFSLKKLEESDFYLRFIDQLNNPETLANFSRVLAAESEMKMVIYGIGSIESYEPPRLQLSLAISLKKKLDWIGGIEIFDPILSATESMVMEDLGCTVISINEEGRREVVKPTLFFMPHCEVVLYDNLLETNWRPSLLNQMVVFGNSFDRYKQLVSEYKTSVVESAKYVLGVGRFSKEIGIETVSDEFFRAFHETSWHFFEVDSDLEMESQQEMKLEL